MGGWRGEGLIGQWTHVLPQPDCTGMPTLHWVGKDKAVNV